MAEKKQDSFTVTDRRLFTPEGELRQEVSEEEVSTSKPVAPEVRPSANAVEPSLLDQSLLDQSVLGASALDPSVPPRPTAAEQKEQADAYRKSAKELDTRVELSGHSAKEMEMTFERFLASLYMTAMLQLGLMQEQGGQPRIDLLGARQTVDTLGLLAEKTKGNLTPAEENFLQNCLYELRMAYVEVTNALARPPQPAGANSTTR
ncbi:MAG TPA: DUF1844 domain-containing protein [Terriglobales bacterium]|jgi:hypothetical protein|nr:DUF1844 domain-containing protein [Terriglobales bacterium]